jgi:hypothetical protein
MEESICNHLNIAEKELCILFDKGYNSNYDSLEKILSDFIYSHSGGENVDEVLLFHFSRRLNTEKEDFSGSNLYELLLKDSSVSKFLKEYDISFKMGEKHLELFHKGKLETFEHVHDGNASNVKWRMGYFEGREDYCFNGFAFKDLLYKNSYASSLFWGPEFLNQMLHVIGRKDVLQAYIKNSKYYCLEYKIPMEKVIIDGHDSLSLNGKRFHIILEVLKRLYDYYVTNISFMYDHDNPCLRLQDNDRMDSKYLVSKEEVLPKML